MDRQKLAALLKESQVPDTQKLKAITAELQKNYYAHPQSLLLLIEILSTHDDAGVRQLAAVAATRLVPKHWESVPKEQKPAVRQHLVEATMKESDAKTRHSESRAIAAIAAHDLDEGEWPELLPALFQLAGNDNVAQKEVGSYIIYSVLEANPTVFAEHVHQLLQLFTQTIQDASSADVRVNTMLGIGAFLMLVEPEEDEKAVEIIHTLVPGMVNVLKDVVERGDDQKIQECFQVFQQFLAYDTVLLSKHLKDLVQFMIDLGANKEADDEVRSQALSFLAQTVRYRRMKIQAMRDMGSQLTIKSMTVLAELDDDEEDDELTPAQSALGVLEELSSNLPPRQVMVPLVEAFPKFATSEDPGLRKAGALALGTCVEGAPDFVATQIKSLMPSLVRLLNDPDAGVRHKALICLASLAEEMPDDLAYEHEALMTALGKNLQAAMVEPSDEDAAKLNVRIIIAACSALDSLADGFDGDVMKNYAQGLVTQIGSLLDHDNSKVKHAAAGGLGAIATALEEDFKPFFEKTVHALGNYLTIKETDDDLTLRSGVCDAMGRIATAVGPEIFQPYVIPLMQSSEEALNLDNSRLRESSFLLWSALAKVYESHFSRFLPGVFKGLFDCLEVEEEGLTLELSEEEKALVGLDEDLRINGRKVNIKSADEDEDAMEDEDEDNWDDIMGASPQALEKEVAIEVIGEVITHACGAAEVKQYLEKSIELIAPLAEHPYEGCRKSAIATLWRAYARVWQLMEEETGVNWEPGFPPKQTPTPALVKLGEIVAKATLELWPDEQERSVVTEINRNIAATLKACGPAILAQEDMLSQVVTLLGTIITRSHPCQMDLGDDDDDVEVEGSSEYDWVVIDTALDVVIGLAAALGPAFGELWKVFSKPILKFVSSNEHIERSTAVGVVAEVTAAMGSAVTPYTSNLMPSLLRRLGDDDKEAKSNAAYAVGQLIFNSDDSKAYLPSYNTILSKLEPMLQIPESRILDNAAGCVCRMIMKHPDKVPIADVLPALVNLLPLKEDYEENKPVYECIYKLYDEGDSTVQQLTPKLIPIFEQVLGPPEEQLEKETRALLLNAIKMIYKAKPDFFKGHQELAKLAASS